MDTAKAFESVSTGPGSFQIGDDDLLMVSDNDDVDPSLSVNENSNLPSNFKRQLAERLA